MRFTRLLEGTAGFVTPLMPTSPPARLSTGSAAGATGRFQSHPDRKPPQLSDSPLNDPPTG